jgi:uncharacterized protein YndB with AHSA1/START domain
MASANTVVAKATTLIRRPVEEVFEAFVDPAQLTRFWLARASDRLEQGKTVHWEFMVPGAEVDSHVAELRPNEHITIAWSDGTLVSLSFDRVEEGTRLAVEHSGFKGTDNEIVTEAIEATQGFTIVLCDLKIVLEQNTSMNLVRDKAALIQRELASRA